MARPARFAREAGRWADQLLGGMLGKVGGAGQHRGSQERRGRQETPGKYVGNALETPESTRERPDRAEGRRDRRDGEIAAGVGRGVVCRLCLFSAVCGRRHGTRVAAGGKGSTDNMVTGERAG